MAKIWLLALLLSGCGLRASGELCSASRQCARGICLKGICSGVACDLDEDCSEDQVCGSISGTRSCLTPCENAASSCPGETLCQTVETQEDEGEEASYCL